tara:strand:- start:861 stop:1145 length:285 start_codon:yes stop_codon:yes gene_type:complete
MAPLTYPTTFAQTIWLPFPESSSIGALITDAASTIADFLSNRCNWVSACGVVYSEADMRSLWEMIAQQKMRVHAFWLISIGAFPALDPAMDSLR